MQRYTAKEIGGYLLQILSYQFVLLPFRKVVLHFGYTVLGRKKIYAVVARKLQDGLPNYTQSIIQLSASLNLANGHIIANPANRKRISVQYGTNSPILLGMDDIFSFLFLWLSCLRKDTHTETHTHRRLGSCFTHRLLNMPPPCAKRYLNFRFPEFVSCSTS